MEDIFPVAPRPIKIVWAVSGRGMLCKAVIAAANAGLLQARISGIVTHRPCPIDLVAAEHGIPLIRLAPEGSDRTRFNSDLSAFLQESEASWAGLTFNRLIGRKPIDAMNGRIFNIHFALLPLFPGLGALSKTIGSGMRVGGVTIHLVDETIDGGKILAQASGSVLPCDTESTLGRRLFEIAVPLTLQLVRAIETGGLSLDVDRNPVWAFDYLSATSTMCFPAPDLDLVAFSKEFCAASA